MARKSALILVKMDLPVKQEADWNHWYNTNHLPARLAIPGILSAQRFTNIEDDTAATFSSVNVEPKYLALYDLADVTAVQGEPYRKLLEEEAKLPADSFETCTKRAPKFARGVYEQLYPEQGEYVPRRTGFIFVVGHDVPRNRRREFNCWYNTEHLPAMLGVPQFLAARRFALAEREVPARVGDGGSLPQFVTVYDLESPSAFDSEAYKKARVSPWSAWVRSWFTRTMRGTYRQIYP